MVKCVSIAVEKNFTYEMIAPVPELSELVDSFWSLESTSKEPQQVMILPDGRIDLSVSFPAAQQFTLLGLEDQPSSGTLKPGMRMLTVSFKPLGLETFFSPLLPVVSNSYKALSADHFNVALDEVVDLKTFSEQMTERLLERMPTEIDSRKVKLFRLLYEAEGAISVAELSEKVHWSSRQINRYFNDLIGIPLKTYCNILRFRAAFPDIKEGKLFPEHHFTDQSHFIKEIRKYSGVAPKALAKNQNNRFIQLATLSKQ